MESRNNNTDFEQFLKQNADQYRMFPSENVWKGIDNALHTRRRWYGLGLALLLLLTGGGVTWVMLSNPATKQQTTVSPAAPEKTAVSVPPIAPARPGNKTSANSNSVVSGPHIYSYPSEGPVNVQQPIADAAKSIPVTVDVAFNAPHITSFKEDNNSVATHSIVNNTSSLTDHISYNLALPLTAAAAIGSKSSQDIIITEEEFSVPATVAVTPVIEKETPLYPMTIESVVNSYMRPKNSKAVLFQLYVAPTVSYRKLSENNPDVNTLFSLTKVSLKCFFSFNFGWCSWLFM